MKTATTISVTKQGEERDEMPHRNHKVYNGEKDIMLLINHVINDPAYECPSMTILAKHMGVLSEDGNSLNDEYVIVDKYVDEQGMERSRLKYNPYKLTKWCDACIEYNEMQRKVS